MCIYIYREREREGEEVEQSDMAYWTSNKLTLPPTENVSTNLGHYKKKRDTITLKHRHDVSIKRH